MMLIGTISMFVGFLGTLWFLLMLLLDLKIIAESKNAPGLAKFASKRALREMLFIAVFLVIFFSGMFYAHRDPLEKLYDYFFS